MSQPYHRYLDQGHPKGYRREEIEMLTRAIRARENRLVLGLPNMGVSNLLRFLVTKTDLVERDITFVYLNCDALDECNEETFFRQIARQLCEQGWGSQPRRKTRGYAPLKQLVEQATRDPLQRIVIVTDQGDRWLAAMDRPFYRKLKALTDLNKRLCFMLAASPLRESRIDPENLLFAGRRVIVGPLNQRDCAGAIAEEARRLEADFNPGTRERLASLTGGHPGLLRAASSAIVEEKLDDSDPETAWLKCLLKRGDIQYRCQKIWGELDATKQIALRTIASGQADVVAKDTLSWLQRFGLVHVCEGIPQVFSSLFQAFVVNSAFLPTIQEGAARSVRVDDSAATFKCEQETTLEPIRIDQPRSTIANAQEIVVDAKVFQGEREVDLSPLMIRLIACLKREPRIYSKDEIGAYVFYNEDQEQEVGISDTRIGDLVRRVRQRLGDQRYIKTHWRRGYEFQG